MNVAADSTYWKRWVSIGFLTLLIHLSILIVRVEWDTPHAPPPVELQSLSPKQLEAVRNQWRRKEKQFLLGKDSLPKDSTQAPQDARYESDRNRRVQREQKARNTQVIPSQALPQPATPAAPPPRVRPNLGSMGVPLKLPSRPKPQPQLAAAHQSGDQYIQEKLPEGGENLLNTQESKYYSFYSRIYEAIGPIWQSRTREITYRRFIRPGEYSTIVDVILDAEGELLGIRHLQDSGIPELDQAVDSSWHRVNRFPNPPRDLWDENQQLHMVWTFTVHVDQSSGFQYLPPERADH